MYIKALLHAEKFFRAMPFESQDDKLQGVSEKCDKTWRAVAKAAAMSESGEERIESFVEMKSSMLSKQTQARREKKVFQTLWKNPQKQHK